MVPPTALYMMLVLPPKKHICAWLRTDLTYGAYRRAYLSKWKTGGYSGKWELDPWLAKAAYQKVNFSSEYRLESCPNECNLPHWNKTILSSPLGYPEI